MKQEMLLRPAVFALLITAGACARLVFREFPNFAPIAAIALFSGYYFRSALVAALVPLLALVASDLVIGGYSWQMMVVVYSMLTLPVAFRSLMRRQFVLRRGHYSELAKSVCGLITCSLASSVLFFLATNFAWWPWTDMYEHNLAGLIHCYQQGLPFFKNTLAGDLFFSVGLFGTFAVCVNFGWAQSPALSAAAKAGAV